MMIPHWERKAGILIFLPYPLELVPGCSCEKRSAVKCQSIIFLSWTILIVYKYIIQDQTETKLSQRLQGPQVHIHRLVLANWEEGRWTRWGIKCQLSNIITMRERMWNPLHNTQTRPVSSPPNRPSSVSLHNSNMLGSNFYFMTFYLDDQVFVSDLSCKTISSALVLILCRTVCVCQNFKLRILYIFRLDYYPGII